ncbi:MAG: hypothetical protein J6P93_02670 [Alphaproteobacteria bacterium]|nr:hypothetical protein [Alphaproteobacteria bacterium]
MQLTPETLGKICKYFGIEGNNAQNLIKEFFIEYPHIELDQTDNFISNLCFSNNGNKILEFSHSYYTEVYDGFCRLPATVRFYAKNFTHTFFDSNTDEFYNTQTDIYQYTITTDEYRYTEKGVGHYNPQKRYSLFESLKDKTTVRYNAAGCLQSIIVTDKKGLAKIKEGLPAKIAAWSRKLPLYDIYQNIL